MVNGEELAGTTEVVIIRFNCNPSIYVIQQDTQYLMINFIPNIQELNMFRTPLVHLQERSYAVCCDLVCLDTL